MPISLSAKKSLRKSLKNHRDNVSFKNKLKTIVKKFLAKPTNDGLKEVYSILDKAVKNIFRFDNSELDYILSSLVRSGFRVAIIESEK